MNSVSRNVQPGMTSTRKGEGFADAPVARWWKSDERVPGDKRVRCDLCPRHCRIAPGQRGFCFVRGNRDGELVLDTYGRSSGFCLDPIEKKPLNHFLPGTSVLSFGTAGCNLGCKFCQNWDISKSRHTDTLAAAASPAQIAAAAVEAGAASVAFTYNDPVIFAEYAIDIAAECRVRGVRTVAVTAGYISPAARPEFFAAMDAVNIDLKGFSAQFYKSITGADLDVVLDTIRYVATTDTWMELTTLLIPGHNDSDEEIEAMCRWVIDTVGPDVPHHFSAFHPDHRMRDVPHTPERTMVRALEIARAVGEHFPYTGNIHYKDGDTTLCPTCQDMVVVRDWYRMVDYQLRADGTCPSCGTPIAGVFSSDGPGDFGARRIPVQISS